MPPKMTSIDADIAETNDVADRVAAYNYLRYHILSSTSSFKNILENVT